MKYKSVAYWPEGAFCDVLGHDVPLVSQDNHVSKESAEAVCSMLERQGYGLERKIFPTKTEVIEVKT